jgi:hypothetical protein
MVRGWMVPALCGLLVLAGCRRANPDLPAPDAPVHLVVSNGYGQPMEIFVSGEGIDQRMGIVNPGMTGRFIVPRNLVGIGSVEVRAVPPGAARSNQVARVGDLHLSSGVVIEFEIATPLFNSTARILR